MMLDQTLISWSIITILNKIAKNKSQPSQATISATACPTFTIPCLHTGPRLVHLVGAQPGDN